MEFIDLAAQQKRIRPDIDKRIKDVLTHGKYIMGPEVKELELGLAKFAGVKHAISCASGTDALLMVLMGLGVGSGDAVFTSSFTFIATAEVIQLLGATPVFIDIDPDTFNIDIKALERAVIRLKEKQPYLNPKAVIPVDLFGLPCDYDRIGAAAEKHGFVVIEDAAQSFGGTYKNRMAGSFGVAGCTSFFPAKPLGCYGDGGAIFTDSDELAEKLLSIRVHGKGTNKYDNVRVGINGRLDTLQAAILLPKLEIFPDELEKRQIAARQYNDLLAHSDLILPKAFSGYQSAWAQYSVLAKNSSARDVFQTRLKEKGIPTAIYYPTPLHLQTAFAGFGYKAGDLPVSEYVASRIFSLPMHPYLMLEEQNKIAEIINGVKLV